MKQVRHDLIIIEDDFGLMGVYRLLFLLCVCLKFSTIKAFLKSPPVNLLQCIEHCLLQQILLLGTINMATSVSFSQRSQLTQGNQTWLFWKAVGWSHIYLMFPYNLKLEIFLFFFIYHSLNLDLRKHSCQRTYSSYTEFYEHLIFTAIIKSVEYLSTSFSWPAFSIFPFISVPYISMFSFSYNHFSKRASWLFVNFLKNHRI